jgi:glycerol-3-phosphate acyltransferase PlsY
MLHGVEPENVPMSTSILAPMLLVFGIGYLLGSIPFGLVLTRAAGLGDVRRIGSGNIGATNVLRTGNKKLAAATLLLDGLKGTVAVILAAHVVVPAMVGTLDFTAALGSIASGAATLDPKLRMQLAVLAAGPWMGALGAVVGHVYPVWLGFKGGKGVATYIGALIGASWIVALVFALAWLATAAITRISSLAALVALAAVLAYLAWAGNPVALMAAASMTALIVWKHRENIKRLIAGTESRIGEKTAQKVEGSA